MMLSTTRLPLALALVLACTHASEAPTRTPTTSTPAQQTTLDCGPAIAGSEPLLQPGLVMLGEMHGSHEIPALVGTLACHGAAQGLAVRVGLELPLAERDAVARYLASEGSEADVAALLQGEFWQRSEQDGRSSAAMLALLERIRVLQAAGAELDAFTFDRLPQGGWNERDAAMAAEILARSEAEPDALVITLSGNLHTRATTGLPWDPEAVPMAQHVRAVRADARTLDVRHGGGSVWACWMVEDGMSCGPMETRSPPLPEAIETPAIMLWSTRGEYEYDGVFVLEQLTPAPPAKG